MMLIDEGTHSVISYEKKLLITINMRCQHISYESVMGSDRWRGCPDNIRSRAPPPVHISAS